MVKSNWWMFKAPAELKDKMDRVATERVRIGKDKKTREYKRIGIALVRHPTIWDDLVKLEFKDD